MKSKFQILLSLNFGQVPNLYLDSDVTLCQHHTKVKQPGIGTLIDLRNYQNAVLFAISLSAAFFIELLKKSCF